MAVMLAFLKVPLTWGQIFKRTFNEAFVKDNCLGMAAQLAYYSMAFRLSELPSFAIAEPVARVTFPGFARMRHAGKMRSA